MSTPMQTYKYFDRTHSEWDIIDFLNDCNDGELQAFSQKIGIYLKSLEVIFDTDKGQRGKRARELLDRTSYEVGVGAGAIYRVVLRSRLKGSRPDRQLAKKWDQKRGPGCGPSIHIHNSTVSGNIQGTGIIEDTSIKPVLKRKLSSKNGLSEEETVTDADNNPFFVSEHGKEDEDEEVLNEGIKLPTPHTRKKAKTSVTSAPKIKNLRPRKNSEKSSSSDTELEGDEEIKFDLPPLKRGCNWEVGAINVLRRFRQYQIEVLEKAKTSGLKYDNIYETLALSSIMVFCWPCPIPLPQEILSSLPEAYCNHFLGNDVFMNGGNSKLSRTVACAFNDLYNSVPDVAPSKMSEDEHCYMFLHPLFTVDRVAILNSESKPVGCTPLQHKKDRIKVQLKARKSINQQIQSKGSPSEAIILLNM
ncbi:482_t:CDS:10, partial [Ambispora gerdemannii]